MALFDWLKPKKSSLGLALARALETGDINGEIGKLNVKTVRTRADGQAVCDALFEVMADRCSPEREGNCYLSELADLCREVEGAECGAFPVIVREGIPLLTQLANREFSDIEAGRRRTKPGNLLFAVKVVAMFGAPESVGLITRLVRAQFHPADSMWSMVFKVFSEGHPLAPELFTALTRPLPDGFIATCLLNSANQHLIAGGVVLHPYDSDEGVARLRTWLEAPGICDSGSAECAVVALAFLSHPERNALLRTAAGHPSTDVRLEAAWAEAKLDRNDGFTSLVRLCMDLPAAVRARRYLEELGRGDLAPREMNDPDFQAQAVFMDWLIHPNELGRPADEMHILDHRTLVWPPEFTPVSVWLLAWRASDPDGLKPNQRGVGITGTRTWCYFSHDMEQRPPEDIYALHCCGDLEGDDMVFQSVEAGSSEYDNLLAQWHGPPLANAQLTEVVKLDSALRHPQKMIAAGTAACEGVDGWIVLDGATSAWYSSLEFPDGESARTILKIHTGRRLLGIPLEASRREWLRREQETLPPERLIAGYERLLDQALSTGEHRQMELLGRWASPLSKHFEEYADARALCHGERRSSVVIETYLRLLSLAETTTAVPNDRAFSSHSPLGERFDDYVKAMEEEQRSAEVMPLVHRFLRPWPKFSHPSLGVAALKAGDLVLAEELLATLLEGEIWHRSDKVEPLAALWLCKGEPSTAGALMLDCLQRILADSVDATGSDVAFHEKFYQIQRAAACRILAAGGIAKGLRDLPESTFKMKPKR